MAVKIRLRRMGAKKAPFYRIVVADSRYPRDGRFIEQLGYYDPTKNPSVIKFDVEKAEQWMKNGAQPTDTVKKLLVLVKENKTQVAEKAPAYVPVAKPVEEDVAPVVAEEKEEVTETKEEVVAESKEETPAE